MKPIRPPAIAQRLVDAYITGLRQRLPVMFIKQLDKLPQATEVQLQSLRKAFPQIPAELTHLLQRFNGSSWEVCVMTSNNIITCPSAATSDNCVSKQSTTTQLNISDMITSDKEVDSTVSPSFSSSPFAEENDINIKPSATNQEERKANVSADAAKIQNEKKDSNKTQDQQSDSNNTMEELQKFNNVLANDTNNTVGDTKTTHVSSVNAGDSTSLPKEGISKKVSKSPPAVAVAAAATAASFIKSTLVGKRSSSHSSTPSTSSKHTRKERNAIPVLGSTFAACPYYLHSIEYMLSRQLPFATHNTLQSPEQTQELEKMQHEHKEHEEEKAQDPHLGNEVHDNTHNTSNATSQETGKLTLATFYRGYTFLHEPPRAPWENAEGTMNRTHHDNDTNVAQQNQGSADMNEGSNKTLHEETATPLNSEKIVEDASAVKTKTVHVDKNIVDENNKNNNIDNNINITKETKIGDNGALHKRCVYIDNRIDPNSDLTLWLNFAQSLFPHHLPKLLTQEEIKEEQMEQRAKVESKNVKENVQSSANLQTESQQIGDMTGTSPSSLASSSISSLPVDNTSNDNNKVDSTNVANIAGSKDKVNSVNNNDNNNICSNYGTNAVSDRNVSLPLYRTTESHLFIDFHPSDVNQAARGQIIQYIRHPESFTVIADDFGSYLKYLMSEEYDFIEELEDDDEDEISTIPTTAKNDTTILVKAEAQTIDNCTKTSKPAAAADNTSQTPPLPQQERPYEEERE